MGLGDDIGAVPRDHVQSLAEAGRRRRRDWRNEKVTKAQLARLRHFVEHTDVAVDLESLALTKGIASDVIAAIVERDDELATHLLLSAPPAGEAVQSAQESAAERIADQITAARQTDARHVTEPLVATAAAVIADTPAEPITEASITAVQDGIDLAAVVEAEDWTERGEQTQRDTGIDTLAGIESDPVTEAAIELLPSRSGEVVAEQFETGRDDQYRQPRTAQSTGEVIEARTAADSAQADPEPELAPAEQTYPPAAGRNYILGTDVVVPSGEKARARANIDAIRLIRQLDAEARSASVEEQAVLAQWSGWGAVPGIFDTSRAGKATWGPLQSELLELLGRQGFHAAAASTLNAHYTDPSVVAEMWRAMQRAGLPEGALMLEPGCGAGYFLGTAPDSVHTVGVELEPITARIAHHLFPQAHVRNHGFQRHFVADATFTGAIGNVPFGKTGEFDPIHNAAGLSLHNQFIYKSLALTKPGGYVAVITSAYTSDAHRSGARRNITELGDLIGAVRLPSGAFDRQAKTAVVTDVLIFRRRNHDQQPSTDTKLWSGEVVATELPGRGGEREIGYLNAYFAEYPHRVLGTARIGHSLNGPGLIVDPDTSTALAEQLRARLDPIIDHAVTAGLGFTATAPELTSDPTASVLATPGLYELEESRDTVLPGVVRWNEVDSHFEQFQIGDGWQQVTCRGKAKIAEWRQLTELGDVVLALTEASRNPASTLVQRDELRAQLNTLYDRYVSTYGPVNRFKLTTVTPLTDEKIAEKLDTLVGKWRKKAAKELARDAGLDDLEDASTVGAYDGPVPDDVLEKLVEEASTPLQPRQYRSHLQGALARDPRMGMVLTVEEFSSSTDGSNAVAHKGPIFTVDTPPVPPRATHAATIDEAIAISLDETGDIRLPRLAELLATSEAEALTAASGKIFPAIDGSDRWEIAATFLSGHVRDKLAAAREAAEHDPHRFAAAVDALEAVVPHDIDPADIGVRPGATWVPIQMYRQFLVEEFGVDGRIDANGKSRLTVELAKTGEWNIKTTQNSRHVDEYNGYRDKYGNPRVSGIAIFNLLANGKPVIVNKTAEELEAAPKPPYHEKLTDQARAASEALSERFEQWLWADGERYRQLERIYNDRFNSYVKPRHDATHKSFPGINPDFKPYDYQRQAVQRFLHDETILLDHVVGAGKTLTVTACCMEAKRLGQVEQPWVVVPNHLLAQWAKESRAAYPNARILVGTELDDVADRQRFIAQSAARDWDMVIVPQSVFKLVGLKRETQINYIEAEKETLRESLIAAKDNGSEFSVKAIQKALKSLEKRLTSLIESKATDDGLTFEQSGCDFVFVDEAHDFKNLSRFSNSPDLAVNDGSQKASDLEMKGHYLRRRNRERNLAQGLPHAPVKALAFATGTPISNSLSEIWVMTKYLRPDILEAAGMGRIDNWAATFARPVTAPEVNITGTSLRMVNRMAQYQNVRQLVAQVDQYRDVVLADQIPVALPQMRGGAPTVVEFDLAPQVLDFMNDLETRLAQITGKTLHLDNTLKIANDGRNATMHPPLAGLPMPLPDNSRVEVAADLIYNCYRDNADLLIPADKYGPEMRGVFQMVFCDRGTPKENDSPHADNVYTALREALVRRGMNRDDIAFIHDYKSDKAKTKLFAACNDGTVRVLLASSKKAGTGVNVQRAMKQLINLDPAWTADIMTQRLGRIIRQGNVHKTVDVANIVARRSYDAMMYQYVERKAFFQSQIRREDAPQRMEDIGGDLTMSWAQTKAAATGDPVYVQQVEADQEVVNLSARRDTIANANAARRAAIKAQTATITALADEMPILEKRHRDLATWLSTPRERRMWHIDDARIADANTPELVAAIQHRLKPLTGRMSDDRRPLRLATIGGHHIDVIPRAAGYDFVLGDSPRSYERDRFLDIIDRDSSCVGLITTLRNLADRVQFRDGTAPTRLEQAQHKLTAAQAEPEQVFTEAAQLQEAKERAEELRMEVNARENSPQALIAKRNDAEKRRAAGQYPKWTLDLNPTAAHADSVGLSTAELREAVPALMAKAAQSWATGAESRKAEQAEKMWKPADTTESRWLYGAAHGSDSPGAHVWWAARQWHWEAWDGFGRLRTGTNARLDKSEYEAEQAAKTLAQERSYPLKDLSQISRDRVDPRLPLPGATDIPEGLLKGLNAARTNHGNNPDNTHSEATDHPDPLTPPQADPGLDPGPERRDGHGL